VKDSIEYYPGHIKIKGKYVNGLKDGVFEYYSDRKYENLDRRYARRLDSTVTYRMGKRNGIKTTYEQFYLQEVVLSTENFVNDKLDGKSIYWHTSFQVDSVKTFSRGKLVSKVKYPRDTTLLGIYFEIRGFPNDTIYLNQYRIGDSLHIELVGYGDRNWETPASGYPTKSLSSSGFKVKSFVLWMFIDAIDLEQQLVGDRFALRGIKRGERFYISSLIISDPNGFECKLPDQRFIVR